MLPYLRARGHCTLLGWRHFLKCGCFGGPGLTAPPRTGVFAQFTAAILFISPRSLQMQSQDSQQLTKNKETIIIKRQNATQVPGVAPDGLGSPKDSDWLASSSPQASLPGTPSASEAAFADNLEAEMVQNAAVAMRVLWCPFGGQ